MKTDRVLKKLREICLALPETKETETWGKPHFRVKEKIFCGYGEEKGKATIGFKLEMKHAFQIIKDPRFWRAPYVGHKGWVSMDASAIKDWQEVKALIHESFSLIAPKKVLAQLQTSDGVAPAKKKAVAKKTAKTVKPKALPKRKTGRNKTAK